MGIQREWKKKTKDCELKEGKKKRDLKERIKRHGEWKGRERKEWGV